MSSFKALDCTDNLLQGVQSSAYLFDQEGMYSLMLFNFVDMYKKCRKTRGLANFWKDKLALTLPPAGPGEKPVIPISQMFPELFKFNAVLWTAIITGDYASFNVVSSDAELLATKYCRSAVNQNIVGLYEFFDGAFDLGRRLADAVSLVENVAAYAVSSGAQLDPNGPYFKSVFGPGGRLDAASKRCAKTMTDLMNAILGKDGGFSFDEVLKAGGIDVIINFLQKNLGYSINSVVFCNIIYPLIGLSREIGGIGSEIVGIVQSLINQLKAVISTLLSLVAEMQKIIQQGITMATALGVILGFSAFAPMFEDLMKSLILMTKGMMGPNTLRYVSLILRDMDCSRRKQVLAGAFSKVGLSDGTVNDMMINLSMEIDTIKEAICGNLSVEKLEEIYGKYGYGNNLQEILIYLDQKRNDFKEFSDRHYREAQADGKFDISKIATPGCDTGTLKKDIEFMGKWYPQSVKGMNQVIL